jgi:NADH:ubiquinone oxidoreductase subunit 3 (subunit A)
MIENRDYMDIILSPPIAILIYFVMVLVLYVIGRALAPTTRPTLEKSRLYAGGEVADTRKAAPGYRRFFVIALLFAILHLAALELATTGLIEFAAVGVNLASIGTAAVIYLIGLAVILLILFLS